MNRKFDVSKLSDSDITQIKDIAMNMTDRQADDIRTAAIQEYVNKAINHRTAHNFSAHCYVIAVVNFLNNQGYEIIKKEETNE